MGKPLVSIITVVYNGEKHIERTINSVLNQTYKPVEYIIIDGGSTDKTIDIISQYTNDISYWVSEKDNGIYDAMNKGIKMAKGEWIGILNADDYYEDDCIEKIIEASRQNQDVDIIHGLLKIIDKQDNVTEIIGHESGFLNKGMIEHPTCFVKKSVYDRLGGFDTKYKSSSDYEFMLRVKCNNLSFYMIEHILANFTLGGMSSSLTAVLETLKIRYQYRLISRSKMYASMMFYSLMSRRSA